MSIFRLPNELESRLEASYNYYDNPIDKKKKKDKDNFVKKGTIYEALELSDKIDSTNDNIEKLFYFDKLKKINENSIVFKNIIEYVQEKIHKSLTEDSKLEYPLGLDIQSFYIPDEIKENNFLKNNKSNLDWYNELDFRTKGIGIDSDLLHSKSIGWNDILDYNQENIIRSVKRLNNIIRNKINNFNFIDLTNTPFNNDKISYYKGIITYIIHGKTKNNNFVPNILFSIDSKSDNIYLFQKNGHIILNTKLSINDILNEYEWAYLTIFFIPLSEESDKLLKQNITNKDLLYLINNNNFISKANQIFPDSDLQILNDKLVIINLLSIYKCIIYGNIFSKEEILEILASLVNCKQYFYILFKGNKEEFNNKYLLNKLDKIKELNIDTNLDDSLMEGYCAIKEFNNNLLNEGNIQNNNNYDYLNRTNYDSLF